MKIQSVGQLVGLPVASQDGHQLGRIAAVVCEATDPYTPEWFVVRFGRLRARLHAVPAWDAEWAGPGLLRVPVSRGRVLASPTMGLEGLSDGDARKVVGAYYTRGPS